MCYTSMKVLSGLLRIAWHPPSTVADAVGDVSPDYSVYLSRFELQNAYYKISRVVY